jgi:tape measure domain-containing protein
MAEIQTSVGIDVQGDSAITHASSELSKLASSLGSVDKLSKQASAASGALSTQLRSLAQSAAVASPRGLERYVSQLSASQQVVFGKVWNAIGTSTGGIGTKILSGIANAWTDLQDKTGGLGGTVALAGLGTAASAAAAAVLAVVAAVGALTIALGAMAIKGVAAFSEFALKTAVFRENTLLGMEVLLKSKSMASKLYEEAVAFADVTPFETADVISGYQKLLAAGFKADELKSVMTSIGDMAASKGMDKSIIDRLILVMGQIKGKGRLQGEELTQLAEMGLSSSAVLDTIGGKMGKTREEVEKLMSAGKISSEVAIPALLETVSGKFGGTMELQSKALSGLVSTLVSRPFALFNDALKTSAEAGTGLSRFVDQVKKGVEALGEFLNSKSATGKEVVSIINGIGGALSAVAEMLRGFGTGVLQGLAEGWKEAAGGDAMERFQKLDSKALAEGLREVGHAIGYAAAGMVAMVAAIGSVEAASKRYSSELQVLKWAAIGIGAVASIIVAAVGIALAGLGAVAAIAVATLVFPLSMGVIIIGACAAALYGVVRAVIWFGEVVWAALDGLADALDELLGSFEGLGALGETAVSALSSGLSAGLGAVTAAAGQLGASARAAFLASFGLGGGLDLGGGAGMASMLTNMALPGGYTLSAPLGVPSAMPAPSAEAGGGGKGAGDQHNSISVSLSGVGLDLAGLASLIRNEATALFKELAGKL